MSAQNLHKQKRLLKRVANGDEAAFHIIYERYFGRVYAMAISYLPSVLLAQDMVQDVFARVWINRAKLLTVDNFEAWLITVARNHLIKELRKAYPSGWEPARVSGGDPYEKLNYLELERLLAEAVGQLSPRQQQVYTLCRVEGYSHKEVAELLGISVDVSREHLSKALQKIRLFLVESYGFPGLTAFLLLSAEFFSSSPHTLFIQGST